MLTAIQCFTILQTSSGRRRLLLTAMRSFTILSTADIVAMQVCQFQKDRDEQARYEFKRVLSMNVRIYLPCRVRLLSGAMTRCNLCYAMFTKDLDLSPIIVQNFSIWIGVRIGEASNPGPRLRRRGPRSQVSMAARRTGILEGQQT